MAASKPLQRYLEDKEEPKVYATPSQPITQARVLTTIDQKGSSSHNGQNGTSPLSSQDSVGFTDRKTDSILSRKSSQSSATSVATITESWGSAEWAAGHVLSCIFKDLGCQVLFPRDSVDDWINHSISHYHAQAALPPTHALCVYCDVSFDSNEPLSCWRDRMNHIIQHTPGASATKTRPDFGVAKDMLRKGCIQQDAYDEYSKNTERPTSGGLRALDYEPAHIRARRDAAERANNRVVVPFSRQERRDSLVARSQRKRHQ